MTVEDLQAHDDDAPTAEEVAAYETWVKASAKPATSKPEPKPGLGPIHGPHQKRGRKPKWTFGRRGTSEPTPVPVLSAEVRTHRDRQWEDMLDELKGFYLVHDHVHVTRKNAPSKALYTWVSDQRRRQRIGELSEERQARLDALGFLWLTPGRLFGRKEEEFDASWMRYFQMLREFIAKHGHSHVPSAWKENRPLGNWVNRQRRFRAQGTLSQPRKELLESVGFAWKGEILEDVAEWERRFSQMAEFIRERGHDRLTMTDKSAPPGLHSWREHQRGKFRLGKLSPERVARLEAIGFSFAPAERTGLTPMNRDRWEMRFSELLRFKEQHGHCLIGRTARGGDKLAAWVHKQRSFYRNGQLSADRIRRLEEIGFCWTSDLLRNRHKNQWDRCYEMLVAFQQKHGHTVVTESLDPMLCDWRKRQRDLHRAGKLSPQRVERLNAIGFAWTASGRDRPVLNSKKDQQWNEKLEQFRAYFARHGHPRVPMHSEEYPGLGTWVWKQRDCLLRGTLRGERRQRLEEAGFYAWETVPVDRRPRSPSLTKSKRSPKPETDSLTLWENGFAMLQAFQQEHGHVDVPANDPKYPGLSAWLHRQRRGQECGSLLFSQVARLEKIGVRF